MVTAQEIDRQLKNIGVTFWFFGNAELRELRQILIEGEVIDHCVLGRYEGGIAVLCSTNLRLLLIDKKPFYLTLEDVRYDMIVEVDFSHRLLNASIQVRTPNKTLNFTSRKNQQLRLLVTYIQNRVLAYRQQHMGGAMQQSVPAWQPGRFIEQPMPTAHHSVKEMAQTAIDGASRVAEAPSIARLQQAINPYARSSFTMRQRISRF